MAKFKNTKPVAPATAAKVRKARRSMTPDQRMLARIAKRGALEAAKLTDRFEMLNAMLAALGSSVRCEVRPDGSRRVYDTRTKKTVFMAVPTAKRLKSRPSLGQPGVHAYRLEAERQQTIEAKFGEVIRGETHFSMPSNMVTVMQGLFFGGMWYVAPEDAAKLSASTIRRTHLSQRRIACEAIGGGYSRSTESGDSVRAIVNSLPSIVRLVSAEQLLAAAEGGKSALDIVKLHGGTTALRHLDRATTMLLSTVTCAAISEALTEANAANKLPKRSAQRLWLQAILGSLLAAEPAKGFRAWLSRSSASVEPALLSPVILADLRVWAAATFQRREGWTDRLSFKKALVRAEAWVEGQQRQMQVARKAGFKGKDVVFPLVFSDRGVGAFHIRQIRLMSELHEAGVELNVCLASNIAYYADAALKGRAAFVAVYETVLPKGAKGGATTVGKLLSVAEVILDAKGKPVAIAQHRARVNEAPPKKQVDAVNEFVFNATAAEERR
jgi:hypothetical protein